MSCRTAMKPIPPQPFQVEDEVSRSLELMMDD